MVTVANEVPGRDELVALYDSVGWTAYTDDPEVLLRAVAGSAFVVAARDDGRLVGLARALSDDTTITYVQDVLVHPSHGRRGIGRALVEAVLDRYAHVRQRVLLADEAHVPDAFHTALGFTRADRAMPVPAHAYIRMGVEDRT